eukprot:TRINITY_DN1673_c0_g1_i1.p1 TRINITY_DN1673_c0_g1~~TRINITY_DN1673_c0_g1_i1.p1  ORF type:complete len:255 (-),score=52.72 TRINITY_DN1673_c0_g1_i1:58-795(-)
MATRAHGSGIIAKPISTVWNAIRDFTFPQKFFSTIKHVDLERGGHPSTVGAVRKITWNTGEWRRQRLIAHSDLNFTISWETIESDPPAETYAQISTIQLVRITETNQTLLIWTSDFSADAPGKMITFEEKSILTNIKELRTGIEANHLSEFITFHVKEGKFDEFLNAYREHVYKPFSQRHEVLSVTVSANRGMRRVHVYVLWSNPEAPDRIQSGDDWLKAMETISPLIEGTPSQVTCDLIFGKAH